MQNQPPHKGIDYTFSYTVNGEADVTGSGSAPTLAQAVYDVVFGIESIFGLPGCLQLSMRWTIAA